MACVTVHENGQEVYRSFHPSVADAHTRLSEAVLNVFKAHAHDVPLGVIHMVHNGHPVCCTRQEFPAWYLFISEKVMVRGVELHKDAVWRIVKGETPTLDELPLWSFWQLVFCPSFCFLIWPVSPSPS